MISPFIARQLALSLPEVEEKKHFHLPDFRVKNKIFASLHEDKDLVMVKLNLVDQSVFCSLIKLLYIRAWRLGSERRHLYQP
jgi:hypothetical protein